MDREDKEVIEHCSFQPNMSKDLKRNKSKNRNNSDYPTKELTERS